MNAFEVLGLNSYADEAQVRAAYRSKVKLCHPDQFVEEEKQKQAEQELLRLNLAYEEALRIATKRQTVVGAVPLMDAKQLTRKLLEQNLPKSALRQLARAQGHDAEWYFLQGEVLMALHQYADAHQAYREAVRLDPDNTDYRRGAFTAAREVKKHNHPVQRAVDAIGHLFHK